VKQMTKITGAEWKAFYGDKTYWPEENGFCHDDVLIHLDGEPSDQMMAYPYSIPNTSLLEIECGYIMSRSGDYVTSLEAYVEKWKKEQTVACFVVECDKDKLQSVQVAIKAAGGKVIE